MSTRSLTMVVDRSAAEDNELGFACNPSIISDKSYVNMYLHHDGYPGECLEHAEFNDYTDETN